MSRLGWWCVRANVQLGSTITLVHPTGVEKQELLQELQNSPTSLWLPSKQTKVTIIAPRLFLFGGVAAARARGEMTASEVGDDDFSASLQRSQSQPEPLFGNAGDHPSNKLTGSVTFSHSNGQMKQLPPIANGRILFKNCF